MIELRATLTNEECERLAPLLTRLRQQLAEKLVAPDSNFEPAVQFNALRKIEGPMIEHLRRLNGRKGR